MTNKCSGCNREIFDDESYFQGSVCPPRNTEKFGCSPYSYYCTECCKLLPHFWNPNYVKHLRKCVKCGELHSMVLENVETGETEPCNVCKDCMFLGTRYKPIQHQIILQNIPDAPEEMQKEIETLFDQVIKRLQY